VKTLGVHDVASFDLHTLFDTIDVDHSGAISLRELEHFLYREGTQIAERSEENNQIVIEFQRRCFLRFGSLEHAMNVLHVFESQQHPDITEERFLSAVASWGWAAEEAAVFWKALDCDCRGSINKQSVRELCDVAAHPHKNNSGQFLDSSRASSLAQVSGASLKEPVTGKFSKWKTHEMKKCEPDKLHLLRKEPFEIKLIEDFDFAGREQHQGSRSRALKLKQVATGISASQPSRPWSANCAASTVGLAEQVLNRHAAESGSCGGCSKVRKVKRAGASSRIPRSVGRVQSLHEVLSYARQHLDLPRQPSFFGAPFEEGASLDEPPLMENSVDADLISSYGTNESAREARLDRDWTNLHCAIASGKPLEKPEDNSEVRPLPVVAYNGIKNNVMLQQQEVKEGFSDSSQSIARADAANIKLSSFGGALAKELSSYMSEATLKMSSSLGKLCIAERGCTLHGKKRLHRCTHSIN
jgi:hypothetical protein